MFQVQFKTFSAFNEFILEQMPDKSPEGCIYEEIITHGIMPMLKALDLCANIHPISFYIVEVHPKASIWWRKYDFHIHLDNGKEIYIKIHVRSFEYKFVDIIDRSVHGPELK